MKPLRLRQKHPRLIYQDFEAKPDGKNLLISFDFLLEPDIRFRPEVSIPVPAIMQESPDGRQETPEEIRNLVFHLGLVEAISYWKAACPPEFIVKAGYLSPDQISWWKHLFIHGLGEFFYRNKIDFTQPDFLSIVSDSSPRARPRCPARSLGSDRNDTRRAGDLILVGGGKDSIVTLETLKEMPETKTALMLNPGPNSLAAARIAGYQNPIIVTRIIGPRLLQLNKQGYLNGHTPFSAYLAFLGILVADLYGYKNVISSNELGAGEASLIYKSMEINHQYSKSLAFEKNFRDYCRNYLFTHAPESHWCKPVDEWLSVRGSAPANLVRREATAVKSWSFTKQSPHYFSFLRPLYELQIARIFANLPSSRATAGSVAISSGLPRRPVKGGTPRNDDFIGKYDSIFVSCNVGRGKFWCGRCPKCAFSYLSLFPFISSERIKDIFKSDLFDNTEIQKHILDLVGLGQYKPFDCVGTKDESILAVVLAVRKNREHPPAGEAGRTGNRERHKFLLFLEQKLNLGDKKLVKKLENKIMGNWNRQNFLPPEYSKLLKKLLITTKR